MNNNIQTLSAILDALMSINTRGNDTITMSNCLQTLNQVIERLQHEETQNMKKDKESEE